MEIAHLLDLRDRVEFTPEELEANRRALRRAVLTLWQTSIVRGTRLRVLDEVKPGRNLRTNVEFFTALVLQSLGLSATKRREDDAPFVPAEPTTWEETGLSTNEAHSIILRFMMHAGHATGRRIAEQLKLPFGLVHEQLKSLRSQFYLQYRGTALVGDYEYELTQQGREFAQESNEHCTYCGAAPVPFATYVCTIRGQSVRTLKIGMEDLRAAFRDMLVNDMTLSQLGQVLSAQKGLFLYGPSGNGKTSLASRLLRATRDTIWIPRTITFEIGRAHV